MCKNYKKLNFLSKAVMTAVNLAKIECINNLIKTYQATNRYQCKSTK